MTPFEFHSLQLEAEQVIDITFDNSTTIRYLLFQAEPTGAVPEKRTYLTDEIVPAIPSKIIVQSHTTGGEEGLELATIRKIEKVR